MRALSRILIVLLPFGSFGQNLVPNSSLDTLTSCTGWVDLSKASPWFNPTQSGSDLLNACGTGTHAIPNMNYGPQAPRSGDGYAAMGVMCTGCGQPDQREYLSVRLTQQLYKDSTYCVEFYVSLADSSKIGIDRIGAHFSIDSLNTVQSGVIPVVPHVESAAGTAIIDTTNWVLVSGQYCANGGEEYITLGNFHDDTSTYYEPATATSTAFYFVDDVAVYMCGSGCSLPPLPTPQPEPEPLIEPCASIFIPDIFSPNDDGNNDVLHVRVPNHELTQFRIYTRLGEKVFETNDPTTGWDGSFRGKPMNAGVFVYYATAICGTTGETERVKGNVTLVR